jgi:alkylhydroperoxidase/carboxymuconolactone decarboxylase family protein YurZ
VGPMHLVMVLLLTAASLRGIVAFDDGPLPGATVKATPMSGSAAATAISTDAQGQYQFEALAPGRYRIDFELDGFESAERTVTVTEGVNEAPAQSLRFATEETITLDCHRPCGSEQPSSEWGRPVCSDYELDLSWIDALKHGDRSVISLIKSRHRQAGTFVERQLLAFALLGTADDSPYWKELFEDAANAVRLVRQTDEAGSALQQWCAARSLDPGDYERKALNALEWVSKDRRSSELLLAALESHDTVLVWYAIPGLAQQRNEAALPSIAQALDALDASEGEISELALQLAGYGTEAADRLARKYLKEEDLAAYDEARAEVLPEP